MRILFLAALLAGCASTPHEPVELKNKFSEAEHAAYFTQGDHVVSGQAFLRQKGGGVVTCAGSPVFLVPATPFFDEALVNLYAGKMPSALNMPQQPIVWKRQCDAQGNFKFVGVPPGRWYVLTEVSWVVPSRNMFISGEQGGALRRTITVPSEPVILSDTDRWAL